jgi:hypothetical protein
MDDGEWTVERHLVDKPPEVAALYHRFIELAQECGPFTYAVFKTAIRDPRISRAEPYTSRLYVHHFRVHDLGQLDEEFGGWLAEAYQVGAGDHLAHGN